MASSTGFYESDVYVVAVWRCADFLRTNCF